jgi:hypothetical protein
MPLPWPGINAEKGFGWQKRYSRLNAARYLRIDWLNAFFKGNSNIDFYDSSNFVTALGLGYTF